MAEHEAKMAEKRAIRPQEIRRRANAPKSMPPRITEEHARRLTLRMPELREQLNKAKEQAKASPVVQMSALTC